MDLMAATSCQDSHFIASPKLLSIRLSIVYKWFSEPFGPALSQVPFCLPELSRLGLHILYQLTLFIHVCWKEWTGIIRDVLN